jgi:membrane protein implicated in regulation of membrane protease activity
MLSIYLGSLLFGGVLLGASIFGGHGDGHGDAGGHAGDGDSHGDGGDAHGGGHDDANHAHAHHQLQLPFFSLRFWAFALAFFGLSGAALTLGGGLGAAAPFVAGGVGLGCGYVSARVLQGLSRRPLGLVGNGEAHVGREGRVLLPVEKGKRGKVRLSISGASTDLIAETDSEGGLAPGETALIVGMRGTVALVERSPASLPPIGRVSIATKTEDS